MEGSQRGLWYLAHGAASSVHLVGLTVRHQPHSRPICDKSLKNWNLTASGNFQEYYETHQLRDYSSSSISWILSLEPSVLFATGLVVGKVSVAQSLYTAARIS